MQTLVIQVKRIMTHNDNYNNNYVFSFNKLHYAGTELDGNVCYM